MALLHRFAPNLLLRGVFARARSPWALRLRRLPVFGAVVHHISYRVAPSGRRRLVRVTAGSARGIALCVDPRFDARYWRGDVEPELQALLPQLVGPGGVAWDVGAYIGFFTFLLARCVGPHGHVVAFEPDPANVDALDAGIRANKLTNVTVRPVAVWSTVTRIGFESREESAEGWHSAVLETAPNRVETTTLENEWTGVAPDLVKIDVEGAEEEVLLGASRLLCDGRPSIVCELHAVRRGRPDLPERVRRLLERNGYSISSIDAGPGPRHILAQPE